jgi:tetratricopeptide (TPR) repeat protein
MNNRSIRIFLSSTFRDFGEERDLLVRKVFPALRTRLKDRFVELVDVDLRWGITVEEAERGEVLPICLAEIDRSRPYFIGMLGERYGWIPPHEGYAPDLLERQPWLKKHQGGKSVTELEILHGVLKNKRMKSRAFFYFRSPAYARTKGGHYVPDSTEDRQRQLDLKRRIKDSGYSVTGYRDPEALAKRMERDLWKLLDAEFPATEVPDAFERESMRHEAYAAPRRRLYLGGDEYIHGLNALIKKNANRILITGQSGGGKSALLANALAKHRGAKTHLLEHYLGSSSDAADAVALVRRVIEYIRRVTGNTDPVAADTEELFDSVPTWLAVASAFAKKNKTRWIFVFDALNNLNSYRDLKWFPAYLPERIQIVVSCLEGEVKEALETKGTWDFLVVEPLDPKGQRQLLTEYLKRFNKSLPADLLNQALGHPLANNPLWLKTLAEELRLFGSHEELSNRLNTLLVPPKGKDENEPPTVDDLFEHVLQRIEGDQGRKLVRDALTAIWASRAGLSEPELLEILAPHSITTGKSKKANKLPPAQWAPVRNALDEMLLESGGRIIFGHDYVRLAVKDRYLSSESMQSNAHKRLAEHFAKLQVNERVAEELPHQWREAKAWRQLEETLTSLEMFESLKTHRSDEEHLGYWLSLEATKGKQLLEVRFKSAWKRWNLPSNKEKTADIAGNLVEFFRYAGRGLNGTFSLTLERLALKVTEQIYGLNSLQVAARLNASAELLREMSDFVNAEKILRRALLIREKVLGVQHVLTAECLNDIGHVLNEAGKTADAEPIYRRALEIREKMLGYEHPDTATSLNNLAESCRMNGNFLDAKSYQLRALSIREKKLGVSHPITASSLNNLGLIYGDTGDLVAAISYFRQALKIVENSLGVEHPYVSRCIGNIALYLENADIEKESLFRRALAIDEKAYGFKNSHTIGALINLSTFLISIANLEEGEMLLRQAINYAEKTLGSWSTITGLALSHLGSLLEKKGNSQDAESLLSRALAIDEKALGLEHTNTGIKLHNLASLFESKGDYVSAEPLYRRALAIDEKTHGPDHTEIGFSLWRLGNVLVELGRFDEGIDLIYRELNITKKHDGESSRSAAGTHRRLGVILRDAGRYKESRLEFQKSLEIFESIHKRKSDEVAGVLNGLGQLEALEGNFSLAEKMFAEALEIRREVSPDNVEDIEKRLAAASEGKAI